MIWSLLLINFLTLMGNTPNVSEKNIYFDIVHKNNIVGSLKASKTKTDAITTYKSATNIETRIIKEFSVHYNYNVAFENAFLKDAEVHITVNKKPHAETITRWKDTYYQVIKDEKDETSINKSINYATVQLYFEEPKNITTCFSEQDASFNTIMAMGNHTYKKINSKGNENLYYYKNGNLIKATIDGGIIKFDIIRKNNH